MEVDIVVVASSVADVQEVLEPVKPLTRVGRGGDSRKSLPRWSAPQRSIRACRHR